MQKTLKIKDVFDFTDSFIFKYLATAITDFDLWTEDEGEQMDLEYLGRWSAEKPLSTLTERFIDEDTETISTADLQKLAKLIYSKYHRAWEQFKKYDDADYDVWDDVENITRTIGGGVTQTPTNWKTVSSGTTLDNYSNSDSSIYGYNSSSPVPDSKNESESSSKITTEQQGTYKTTENRTETEFRKGSSKLRTGAEMMEFDEKFWTRWNFINAVYRTVDQVLCADFYEIENYFL